MGSDPRANAVYTDFASLTQLRASARKDQNAALDKTAKQFEAIFTQMMLKSMRGASIGGGALDSEQSKGYRDMFDQQLALSLSSQGHGLGIADMLKRQLAAKTPHAADATTKSPTAAKSLGVHPATSYVLPPRPPKALPLATSGAVAAGASAPLIPLATNALAPTPSSNAIASTASVLNDAGQLAGKLANELAPYADVASRSLDRAASTVRTVAQKWLPSGPADFVKSLAPYAEAAAKTLGVSSRALLAQAALETGWGKHMPRHADGSTSFNLFGLKAGGSWDGARANVPTVEYEDGVAVRRQASFRAYGSPADAFADFAKMIGANPRYAHALGHGEDVAGFAKALQTAGYATDPAYAHKLRAIADSAPMRDALDALKNAAPLPSS